ncbi:hypothetical protein AAFF_G00341160 [Aldrovandia affinis]|uniref:Uncharacterized protein n=1 Tax=Aldrovandia affinis TaxID=143900 RepID=A0AAD7SL96_9TELE|nr:hypothetical protein AAFF_G00341160 [Aldrovandia affinis]
MVAPVSRVPPGSELFYAGLVTNERHAPVSRLRNGSAFRRHQPLTAGALPTASRHTGGFGAGRWFSGPFRGSAAVRASRRRRRPSCSSSRRRDGRASARASSAPRGGPA